MGTFTSDKEFICPKSCIPEIENAIVAAFETDGFEVKRFSVPNGGFELSMTKGGMFKAVVGMKSALKVTANPTPRGVHIEAGIGIFGQQALPTVVTMFVFWPVLIPQIWGMIQQAQLDGRVLEIAEATIANYGEHLENMDGFRAGTRFCTQCGAPATTTAKFCQECGAKLRK